MPPESAPRADGLIIEDMTVGTGAECRPGVPVLLHYRGTLKSNGTEFDSSYKRNAPAAFPLPKLIKGWQEGVPGMKVGGKRKLTVPWALGYGERGSPPKIPARADLVFEIELLGVVEVEDVEVGTGEEVRPGATVTAHYKGTFKHNGRTFDASRNHGDEPITFALDEVIPGWTYGLPGMRVGGTRRLVIPYQFAYGERGSPPEIPAKSDLIFEVELTETR